MLQNFGNKLHDSHMDGTAWMVGLMEIPIS